MRRGTGLDGHSGIPGEGPSFRTGDSAQQSWLCKADTKTDGPLLHWGFENKNQLHLLPAQMTFEALVFSSLGGMGGCKE